MNCYILIDSQQAVLPQDFSLVMKRENPFFTKKSEYSYDLTLRLDNPVNQRLYGFLGRVNKHDTIRLNRPAVIIADGHVYCEGTEVITGWTADTVTIQIVAGNSAFNLAISDDLRIEDLDLGQADATLPRDSSLAWPDREYCLPTLRDAEGNILNVYTYGGHPIGQRTATGLGTAERIQPYLCTLLRKIFTALGYTLTENQIEQTPLRYLFIVNTVFTTDYARMLPGWTVSDFLSEVERLFNAVILVDSQARTASILLKASYYQAAPIRPLSNVADEYEAEITDGTDEYTAANLVYDLPDHYWTKFMRLPEGFMKTQKVVDYDSFFSLLQDSNHDGKILHDTSTDRYYIYVRRETFAGPAAYYVELNQFADLKREGATSDMEMKITPAPMASLGAYGSEIIDLGTTDGYQTEYGSGTFGGSSLGSGSTSDDTGDTDTTIDQQLRDFADTETSAADLYIAFHNGTRVVYMTVFKPDVYGGPLAYTDAYHAAPNFHFHKDLTLVCYEGTPEGSLRLQDLDAELTGHQYVIDTTRSVTFETFDPNIVDTRSLLVIRNRRFVVREIEETITAYGRKPLWRITCHPITVTDEAFEQRWVLTRGLWDDGGAWMDDGRWND